MPSLQHAATWILFVFSCISGTARVSPKAPPNSPRLLYSFCDANEPFLIFSNPESDGFEMDSSVEYFEWRHFSDDANRSHQNYSLAINPVNVSTSRDQTPRTTAHDDVGMRIITNLSYENNNGRCTCCGITKFWLIVIILLSLLFLIFISFSVALLVHTNG